MRWGARSESEAAGCRQASSEAGSLRWGGYSDVEDSGCGDCCGGEKTGATGESSPLRAMGLSGGFRAVHAATPLYMMGVATDSSGRAPLPWSSNTNKVVNGGPGSDLPTSRDLSLCDANPPYIYPPALSATNFSTQVCFFTDLGATMWPETECCKISMNETDDCTPPSTLSAIDMILSIPNAGDRYINDLNQSLDDDDVPIEAQRPTWTDGMLLGAALSLLTDHLDIALWATCLVKSWSPEMRGLDLVSEVQTLLQRGSNNQFPLTVTWVKRPTSGNVNATIWAFTKLIPNSDGGVGLIVPLESAFWHLQAREWEAGGDTAFCAAIQVAATILHELIHIAGDGHYYQNYTSPYTWWNAPGALHDIPPGNISQQVVQSDYPCWDEARMISTIFLWSMSRRFTCLTNSEVCSNMGNNKFFAYSASTSAQIRNE